MAGVETVDAPMLDPSRERTSFADFCELAACGGFCYMAHKVISPQPLAPAKNIPGAEGGHVCKTRRYSLPSAYVCAARRCRFPTIVSSGLYAVRRASGILGRRRIAGEWDCHGSGYLWWRYCHWPYLYLVCVQSLMRNTSHC